MKKLEKLVPVVVAGMVVTGLTTMDAVAADDLDAEVLMGSEPIVEENAENEDKSRINNATPVGEPETDKETDTTTTEMVVNPDVDEDGTIIFDGQLEVTEIPSEKEPTTEVVNTTKETTDEDGTTTTITTTETTAGTTTGTTSTTEVKTETTTTNPDGSTTTTTTTETTTTETTETTTEIKGEITSTPTETPIEPTDEEQAEIKDAVGDALDQAKDEDGTIDRNGFEVEGYDKTEVKDKDGKLTITLTSTNKEESPKHLTQDELGKILGVDLTENEDGTYSYTDENGDTVTVKVEKDDSTETTDTTTKWEIEVEEKTKPSETQTEDVQKNPVDDIEDSVNQEEGALSVKDILNNVDGKVTETDDDGRISKVVDGSKTYEFTYEEDDPVTIEGLSNEKIVALLPDSYTLGDDGEIYDAAGHKLTFEAGQTVYTPVTISVKVTDTQGGKDNKIDFGDGAQDANKENMGTASEKVQELKEQAVDDAVKKALEDSGITGETKLQKTSNEDGIWTVTVTATVDGVEKTFTYTVAVKTDFQNDDMADDKYTAEIVDKSGQTVTWTGIADVTGEKIVWGEQTDESKFTITTEGKVNFTGESFEDATVVKDKTEPGTVVTQEKENGDTITKTYTLRYETITELEKLTNDEKTALLEQAGVDVEAEDFDIETFDFSKVNLSNLQLQRVTWELTETRIETTVGDTETTGDTVTKDENGYTFTKDGTTVYLTYSKTTGTYTGTDGATYEIKEEDVPLADIEAILQEKYGVNLTVDENGVASYTDSDGNTVTVGYTAGKQITVNKIESQANDEAGTDLDQLIKNIIDEIKGLEKNEALYINGRELLVEDGKLYLEDDEYEKIEITKDTIKTEFAVVEGANFNALDDDDLKKLLDALWQAEKAAGTDKKDYSTLYPHFDLNIDAELSKVVTDEDGNILTQTKNDGSTTVQTEAVLGGGVLLPPSDTDIYLYATADDLIAKENGFAVTGLNDYVTENEDYDGKWEYASTGKNNVPNIGDYHFYSVTGTVAYDFVMDGDKRQAYDSEAAAKNAVKGGNGGAVKIGNTWYAYKSTAQLTAYGYMAGRACGGGGYDLMLGALTMTPEGTIIATGAEETYYSVNLVKKVTTQVASGSSLTVDKITAVSKSSEESSELTGKYQVIQEKTGEDLKDTDGKYLYTGNSSFAYDTYQTWATTYGSGTATGNQYAADATLSYTYQVPDGYKIVVDSEGNANITGTQTVEQKRDVKVELSNTTTSTNTVVSDPVVTVTPPEDETPETETPGTTTPGTPGTTVTPGTPAGTPVADVEISDEDVPLAETPDAEDDFVEIADEEVPLAENVNVEDEVVDIADEDVPLAESIDTEDDFVEIADEQVPLTDLPDEGGVPLADVPQTGDSFGMWMMAAAASALALVIPSLRRKKDQE